MSRWSRQQRVAMASRSLVAALVSVALAVAVSACGSQVVAPASSASSGSSGSPASSATPTALTSAVASPAPTVAQSAAASSAPTAAQSAAASSAPTAAPDVDATLAPIGQTEAARVILVVDGDTIRVDRGFGSEPVRYIGIDTPERDRSGAADDDAGLLATVANAELVEGREVVLERDVSETDRYGRLLRHVWLRDGESWTLVSLALVEGGFARAVSYPPDLRYGELFRDAQARAERAGVGLWTAPGAAAPTAPGAAAPTTAPAGAAPTTAPAAAGAGCDPSYPTVCIPPAPPDLDCGDIPFRRFEVTGSDPHRFDGNGDGVGCESG